MTATTNRVAVVGGGIAGLAAAWELVGRLPALDVTVYEAAPQIGGKLRVGELAGHAVDVGAEALLIRRPEGRRLIESLGLDDDLVAPLTLSAGIRARGSNHAIPRRTLMGIPGDLDALAAAGILSAAGLSRVAAEARLPPLAPLSADVAVGRLVRERMGDELAERVVEPLLGGVYAGDPDRLSLVATAPALYHQLRSGGSSLVAAAARLTDAGGSPPAEVFASLRGGLGTLAPALASRLPDVRTGTTVREIVRTEAGFRLTIGSTAQAQAVDVDAVVIATPAAKAARLLRGVARSAATELDRIDTASVAIVSLAYRDAEPPPGSGLLIGSGQGFTVKAITVTSHKWPGAEPGLTLLRASIGRVGDTSSLQRDDDELVGLAAREVGALLGVSSTPIDHLVTRWGGGLPQYDVGHGDRVARIRTGVEGVPGLAMAGASYEGIGVPACIASGTAAADRVIDFLARGGPAVDG